MPLIEEVNPFAIRPGDTLVLGRGRTHKVRSVSVCSTPECVHIDGNCYDARFTDVKRHAQP